MHFFRYCIWKKPPVNVHSLFFCVNIPLFSQDRNNVQANSTLFGRKYMENAGTSSNGLVLYSAYSQHSKMHLNEFVAASEELMLAVIVSRADYILQKPCFARFIATMRFRHGKSTTQHILHCMHSKPQAPIEICVFIQ